MSELITEQEIEQLQTDFPKLLTAMAKHNAMSSMSIVREYDLPHLTEEEHSLHLRFTMAVAKRMFEMTDKLPKKQGWEKPYPMITQAELDSMRFAVRVCEQVKSNAIVMVQGTATVGIGPGQTSRVEAVKIAARRAGDKAKGSVLASDAFFPFKDGLEQAAGAGASAIVQPGGSIRDQEVIDAADALGVSMLFTGHRLFRHWASKQSKQTNDA